MDLQMIAENLLAGPILFFVFGFVAVTLRSDLELPAPVPKLLSLFLVIAIGLKGGMELNHGGLTPDSMKVLGIAVAFSMLVPLYCFFILRSRCNTFNAAAISATYGSVSAVTFITAISALEGLGIEFHGYMVAAMALMEAPAIVVGVMLVQYFCRDEGHQRQSIAKVFHDAVLHGPILLLLGSLTIGRLMSHTSAVKVTPMFDGLFPGVLCLYLFEMGLTAARKLQNLNLFDRFLLGFAVLMPLFNAGLAIAAGTFFGISQGDTILLTVLAASASYIAVPAAMQLAVPKADASLYMTMALGITFPFNIAIGIPLYVYLTKLCITATTV
jgi:uncharacterized protein